MNGIKILKGRRPVTLTGKVTDLKDEDVLNIKKQFNNLKGTNLQRYRLLSEQFKCSVRIIERIIKERSFKHIKLKTVSDKFSFLSKIGLKQ